MPPPPPPSRVAPASPVMPQILRPGTERPSERIREQSSLTHFQPRFLPPINETSPLEQSFPSTNIHLRRSPAVRRSSNPESFSSLVYIPPGDSRTITTTPSPSSHFDFHQTDSDAAPPIIPEFSKAFF